MLCVYQYVVKEFTYYQSMPDMMLGVKSKKTDAGLMNNAVARLAVNREKELAMFPESLGDSYFGLGFAKEYTRCEVWREAYERIPDETKQALWDKWTGADESAADGKKIDVNGAGYMIK